MRIVKIINIILDILLYVGIFLRIVWGLSNWDDYLILIGEIAFLFLRMIERKMRTKGRKIRKQEDDKIEDGSLS